jgi:hypothetical protein
MQIQINVSDKDGKTEVISANVPFKGKEKAIREAVIAKGFDWKDSDIFVANFPERGRYLQKSTGFFDMCAGG